MNSGLSLLVIFIGGSTLDPSGDKGVIDRKTLSALKEFQIRLGGNVYFGSAAPVNYLESDELIAKVPSDSDKVILLNRQVNKEVIAEINPDMILISVVDPAIKEFMDFSGKIILIDDYSARVRLDASLVEVKNLFQRSRITLGHYRNVLANRRKVQKSVGIQCNGYAAFDYYKDLNSKAHLFFDHRVSTQNIFDSMNVSKSPSSRIRLGFSGRLQQLKGVLLFEPLLDELDSRGVQYTFDVMGDGIERKTLEERLSGRVIFHGFMNYDTEWLPFVRENIDLMILPHIQGDSSSTYFESLGAGVPVVGFENDSLTPLAKNSDAALTVPMGNIHALADAIERLSKNPDQILSMRNNAFTYMLDKSYEKIMDARVEHLLSL